MEKEKKIAYQNKDIASKILSEQFRGKSFSVYGIDLPEIEDIRPTNLPAVEADELRLDNLFLLADGSYVFVDYECLLQNTNIQSCKTKTDNVACPKRTKLHH